MQAWGDSCCLSIYFRAKQWPGITMPNFPHIIRRRYHLGNTWFRAFATEVNESQSAQIARRWRQR